MRTESLVKHRVRSQPFLPSPMRDMFQVYDRDCVHFHPSTASNDGGFQPKTYVARHDMRRSPTYPQGLLPLLCLPAALYKGDSRTRTLDISVNGVVIMTWTSSGETAGFETIELGVQGAVIDLYGVLADSDWLSILEVGAAEDIFPSVVCTARGAYLRKPYEIIQHPAARR